MKITGSGKYAITKRQGLNNSTCVRLREGSNGGPQGLREADGELVSNGARVSFGDSERVLEMEEGYGNRVPHWGIKALNAPEP